MEGGVVGIIERDTVGGDNELVVEKLCVGLHRNLLQLLELAMQLINRWKEEEEERGFRCLVARRKGKEGEICTVLKGAPNENFFWGCGEAEDEEAAEGSGDWG